MLTKDDVLSLRDLALAHLPEVVELSNKMYKEHHNSRWALQAVAWEPEGILHSPVSTTVERLAARLLRLVGKHPDTHIEPLNEDVAGDDFPGLYTALTLADAERDRHYLDELLMGAATELCRQSGVGMPAWMSAMKHAESSDIRPLAVPLAQKPKKKIVLQQDAILGWFAEQGLNPLELPKRVNGHASVKSAVRKALNGREPFEAGSSFEKAWNALRVAGQIGEVEEYPSTT